ncbi:hypothetical protein L596_026816 [Steinernema carpocapsae]|uniref:Uncharacterized protein n=1 Tax=Steinernema carpocapsae TaxID=34508 RepID=A0A4V5ZYA7_STECR|nr:hypothetical protein L596_026816 [Steinernema carpocapsae]
MHRSGKRFHRNGDVIPIGSQITADGNYEPSELDCGVSNYVNVTNVAAQFNVNGEKASASVMFFIRSLKRPV